MSAVDEIYKDGLQTLDSLAVALCILVILVVGFVSSVFNRGSLDGYFLANRRAHFIPVGLSIFVSNIGTEHFVALVGASAKHGIAVALYEIQAMLVLPILGWLFMPVYIASGVATMPEYIKLRFGGARIRLTLALFSLLIYMFTKISAVLYAGTVFVKEILHWNLPASLFLVLAIASACTIFGGMTGVLATDALHAVLMIAGTIVLSIYGFNEVGGYKGLLEKYPYFVNPENSTNGNITGCRLYSPVFTLWRSPDSSVVPAPGYLGILVISLWYWCTDQVIVQRALASKNLTHAKAGTILAGLLKVLPMFTLVFPGVIVRILHSDIVACESADACEKACGQREGCSNQSLPLLIFTLLPDGLRGLFVGVMLAAQSSSMTSIFNSSSTIITKDIWLKIRRSASNKEQLLVGRLSVLGIVIFSALWILVILHVSGDSLYHHIQKTSAFLSPPIAAMFIAALFWPRATEPACFYSLLIGMLMGLVRLALEYAHVLPVCGETDPRPDIITKFHYLYYSIFLFVMSACIIIVVSLLTKPIDKKHLHGVMFSTRHDKERRVPFSGTSDSSLVREMTEENPEIALPTVNEPSQHKNSMKMTERRFSTSSGMGSSNTGYEVDGDSRPDGDSISLNLGATSESAEIGENAEQGISPHDEPPKLCNSLTSSETSLSIISEGRESDPTHSDSSRRSFDSGVNEPSDQITVIGESDNSISAPTEHSTETPERRSSLSISGDLAMFDFNSPSPRLSRRIRKEEQQDKEVERRVRSYPKYQQAILWVFGIDKRVRSAETHIEEAVNLERHKSLKENRIAKWVCNVACLLLVAVSLFLHIYDWSST